MIAVSNSQLSNFPIQKTLENWKTGNWKLIIFLIILFCLRYYLSLPTYKNGDVIRIASTVYSDPIRYEKSQYLKLENLKIYLPLFPEISYGDSVVIEGIVNNQKLQNPKLISVKEKENLLANFRNKLILFYRQNLPEPYAGLISGIILGAKGGLTSDFWEMVKKVGVAHVVVASGTNVTFVASFLMGFLTLFVNRRKSIYIAMISIILYLFISGFDAPLVRAVIMIVTVYLGQLVGREVSSWRILFLTVILMLFIKPIWISDIGFILSFASTASLMLFEAKIRTKIKYVPAFLKEGLSTSLAAQIGVGPILFVTFGQFNIWSPIVNMLVLWTVPLIMVIGSVGGLVGLVVPILGKVIVWLTYPLLWWFTEITRIFNF